LWEKGRGEGCVTQQAAGAKPAPLLTACSLRRARADPLDANPKKNQAEGQFAGFGLCFILYVGRAPRDDQGDIVDLLAV
jgi:hypothetical protein